VVAADRVAPPLAKPSAGTVRNWNAYVAVLRDGELCHTRNFCRFLARYSTPPPDEFALHDLHRRVLAASNLVHLSAGTP